MCMATCILLLYADNLYIVYTVHRLSLFRLSEVRPPRYTGHLVWHRLLTRSCTKLALKCGHSLFCILASTGCPKLGIFIFITAIIMMCGLAHQIGLHFRTVKLVINRFEQECMKRSMRLPRTFRPFYI